MAVSLSAMKTRIFPSLRPFAMSLEVLEYMTAEFTRCIRSDIAMSVQMVRKCPDHAFFHALATMAYEEQRRFHDNGVTDLFLDHAIGIDPVISHMCIEGITNTVIEHPDIALYVIERWDKVHDLLLSSHSRFNPLSPWNHHNRIGMLNLLQILFDTSYHSCRSLCSFRKGQVIRDVGHLWLAGHQDMTAIVEHVLCYLLEYKDAEGILDGDLHQLFVKNTELLFRRIGGMEKTGGSYDSTISLLESLVVHKDIMEPLLQADLVGVVSKAFCETNEASLGEFSIPFCSLLRELFYRSNPAYLIASDHPLLSILCMLRSNDAPVQKEGSLLLLVYWKRVAPKHGTFAAPLVLRHRRHLKNAAFALCDNDVASADNVLNVIAQCHVSDPQTRDEVACTICAELFGVNESRKKCSRCGTAYCSKSCQLFDWKHRHHKVSCQKLALQNEKPAETAAAIGHDHFVSTVLLTYMRELKNIARQLIEKGLQSKPVVILLDFTQEKLAMEFFASQDELLQAPLMKNSKDNITAQDYNGILNAFQDTQRQWIISLLLYEDEPKVVVNRIPLEQSSLSCMD